MKFYQGSGIFFWEKNEFFKPEVQFFSNPQKFSLESAL
jgi:hypothetical protein